LESLRKEEDDEEVAEEQRGDAAAEPKEEGHRGASGPPFEGAVLASGVLTSRSQRRTKPQLRAKKEAMVRTITRSAMGRSGSLRSRPWVGELPSTSDTEARPREIRKGSGLGAGTSRKHQDARGALIKTR
jgi:hypothetical protein